MTLSFDDVAYSAERLSLIGGMILSLPPVGRSDPIATSPNTTDVSCFSCREFVWLVGASNDLIAIFSLARVDQYPHLHPAQHFAGPR